jgi:hypothetical protein
METKSRPITATSGHLGQLRIDFINPPPIKKKKKKTASFFFFFSYGFETDNLKQQNILKQQKRFIFFHFLDYMCKNDYETKAYDGGRYCFLFKNI